MGGRVRLSLLGAIFIEMGRVPSGCHLRDSSDQQSAASGGQHGGWFWPAAGRENQTADGRAIYGELATRTVRARDPVDILAAILTDCRVLRHQPEVFASHNEVPPCRSCRL